jgi:hypothetical protein
MLTGSATGEEGLEMARRLVRQRFKVWWDRHGEVDWIVFVGGRALRTRRVLLEMASAETKVNLKRQPHAYLTGVGRVFYKREATLILP